MNIQAQRRALHTKHGKLAHRIERGFVWNRNYRTFMQIARMLGHPLR